MKKITIDQRNYPIVLVNISSQEPTVQEYEEYLDELLAIHRGDARFVIIFDTSRSKFLSSELRIKQGNWLKQHDERLQRHAIAHVFVINSIMVSMILKGIFMIKKPVTNYTIVSSLNEAMAWAEQQVQEEKGLRKAA